MATTGATHEELLAELAQLREQNQQLQRQLRIFQQALDVVPGMVVIKGPKSHILHANRAFCDLYGMTQEQLRDLIDAPFNEPDYTQQYVQDDLHVFNTGETITIPREPVTRHDGVERQVTTIKAPLRDEAGSIIGTVAVIRDITDQLEAQERAERAMSLLEATTDFVGIASMEHSLFLNPAGRRMVGIGPDEDIHAIPMIEYLAPQDREHFVNEIVPTALRDGVWRGEISLLARDGRVIPVSQVFLAHKDPDGTPAYFSTIMRDISEQRHAEESRLRLAEILEATTDIVGMARLDGFSEYLNRAGRELLCLSDNTDISSIHVTAFVPEHVRGHFAEHIMPMAMRNGIWSGESELLTQDGRIIPVSQVILVHKDSDGHPSFISTIIRDISQQKEAEAALRERLVQEETIRAQEAALAELSTPLIPISDKIVIMPLIGTMDSRRAQQVLDTLLTGIAESHATTAILDITGVAVVDTQVANALVRAAQAVQLLGARVILTGIRPEVAQTLVGLGTDLRGIVTRGTLQAGISYAMD